MKSYTKLEDIIKYITNQHKSIKSNAVGSGVCATKMIRLKSGRRIVFEENQNWRIFDWGVQSENSLYVDSLIIGYSFKGHKEIQQSSRLFLSDLVIINVYDFAAEFISQSSIDFAYTLNDAAATMQHLYEYTRGKVGDIKARWIYEHNDIDRMLDEVSMGRTINIVREDRTFDMDSEI